MFSVSFLYKQSYMRLILLFFFFPVIFCQAQTAKEFHKQRIMLPNGWSLSPAGKSIPLGDLPLNMAVSKSKKYLAVTNNGQSIQSIQLFDLKTEKLLDSVSIEKSWYGLKFSGDNKKLYASGGNDNCILQYNIIKGRLLLADSFNLGAKWPVAISPAGIEVDDRRNLLYVVTKENNSLYIVDLKLKNIKQQVNLPAEAYTCLLSPNNEQLYISCWGCDKVLIFDTRSNKLAGSIPSGDNPNELCLSANGRYLFVANANDNSVTVINTKEQRVIETLDAALYPASPSGSGSNGLALSGDEKTLYIANADNNCLAVFDVSKPGSSLSKGFIPVGWYPTNVKVVSKKIFVSNGKGFSSMSNPYGPNPLRKKESVIYQQGDSSKAVGVQYIAGLFKGTLSIINEPSPEQLAVYSEAVYSNTPYNKKTENDPGGIKGNPIPMHVGDTSPIKYVFYVIKENRTYDQVLGDMQGGNGDSSLVLFGNEITPNQHRIAREFVLLDNFYVDAEVSADGHNWSMGAYATDYLEKTWPTSYGGRGGKYDAEGNRAIANNKNGFIWDQCKRNNVSYRTYGEFADNAKPTIPVLKENYCKNFDGYNLAIKDTTRFFQWRRDFDSLLAVGAVPQFNTVRFGNDHTEGLRKNKPTPFAHVADNDLAVGLFIEHLGKSAIWNQTAIFILEDDAQNGSDHVDAHRSTAYIAGGFIKRNFIDHTMYSTSSMLRTMELILGLPPMTQYDAAAKPMWNCFDNKAYPSAFRSLHPLVDLNQKNTAVNEWQRLSESFDLSKEDAAPDIEFNRVIWHAVKGGHIPFPGPRRAAFVKLSQVEKEED